METIVINNIQFDFVVGESGSYIYVRSKDCEQELLNFIRKDWPKNLTKRPQVQKHIEEMINIFYGVK